MKKWMMALVATVYDDGGLNADSRANMAWNTVVT